MHTLLILFIFHSPSFSIGYPVVTLGFGVKSYVSYRIRHRKQREVAKENDFFMQLLKLALPNDDPANDDLLAQIRKPSELLHSATLGEIDLPISSAIIGKSALAVYYDAC